MSLSAFKERILSEAAANAEAIAHKNSLAIQEERSRTTEELRAVEEAVIAAAEKEAQLRARSIRQQAKLAGRSLVLTAKQEELARIKEEFLASLMQMSETDKKKVTDGLLRLVPKTKGEVIPAENNNGLVFQGEGIEINLTHEALVDQVFWKYRSELAKDLFL